MDINELTLGQIKEISNMTWIDRSDGLQPFIIGQAYLIRAVTNYTLGRVVAVGPQEVVLEEAGWVANTGRLTKCLTDLTVEEYEPAPDGHVIVGRGAVVDAYRWSGDLPKAVIE